MAAQTAITVASIKAMTVYLAADEAGGGPLYSHLTRVLQPGLDPCTAPNALALYKHY